MTAASRTFGMAGRWSVICLLFAALGVVAGSPTTELHPSTRAVSSSLVSTRESGPQSPAAAPVRTARSAPLADASGVEAEAAHRDHHSFVASLATPPRDEAFRGAVKPVTVARQEGGQVGVARVHSRSVSLTQSGDAPFAHTNRERDADVAGDAVAVPSSDMLFSAESTIGNAHFPDRMPGTAVVRTSDEEGP